MNTRDIIATSLLVFTTIAGITEAQSAEPPAATLPTPTPGWQDLHKLNLRLAAIEAENQWLRNHVNQTIAHPEASVTLASHERFYEAATNSCETQASCADCNWLDQVCLNCKEGLSWNKGNLRITPFGYVAADVIASEKSYVILGGPLFLLPAVPPETPDARFTLSGQQTTFGFQITGPDLASYESSAVVAFNFFGNRPVQNNPGVFFLLGYVQLKNNAWRFWAGQDADALGRQNTNSPAWTNHKQSGNFGQVRPGLRAERYLQLGDRVATSIYCGLTQQVVLDFIANPLVAGTDNGWPNVEFRWEIDLGTACNDQRPIMLAVGGLVGQTRALDLLRTENSNVSSTWAVIPEVHVQFDRWGFQGELFAGDAIGTYNAGIGQSLNPVTGEGIYTAGGFGELYYNLNPFLKLSVGYGIDDPRNSDLAPNQRSRNETYWTNAVWRLTEQWEARFEIARQQTNYVAPSRNNRAMEYLMSLRYNF